MKTYDNYINALFKLLKFTDTKINSYKATDVGVTIKTQYYEWEEEIIIDFIPSMEGCQGHDVSCQYKKFNQPLMSIGWNELQMEIFSKSLEM